MPSSTPKQRRVMSAIAHGWRPSNLHIPVKVAKEFHAADKGKKWGAKPKKRADGGPVDPDLERVRAESAALDKEQPHYEPYATGRGVGPDSVIANMLAVIRRERERHEGKRKASYADGGQTPSWLSGLGGLGELFGGDRTQQIPGLSMLFNLFGGGGGQSTQPRQWFQPSQARPVMPVPQAQTNYASLLGGMGGPQNPYSFLTRGMSPPLPTPGSVPTPSPVPTPAPAPVPAPMSAPMPQSVSGFAGGGVPLPRPRPDLPGEMRNPGEVPEGQADWNPVSPFIRRAPYRDRLRPEFPFGNILEKETGRPMIDNVLRSMRQYEPHLASGGAPQAPWYERGAMYHLNRMAQGFAKSSVPGRTDKLNLDVGPGSYILPADTISHLGQNNSLAGAKVANRLFGKRGTNLGLKGRPRMGRMFMASGGQSDSVPIRAAGGEYVLDPEQVRGVGGGDLDRGHAVLDQFVMNIRKHHIKTLKGLPKPKQ